MSQIEVKIGEKKYRLACEEGQEKHLRNLANKLEESIIKLYKDFGDIGHHRLLVMACLKYIDIYLDAQNDIKQLNKRLGNTEKRIDTLIKENHEKEELMSIRIIDLCNKLDKIVGKI